MNGLVITFMAELNGATTLLSGEIISIDRQQGDEKSA